MAVAQPLRGIRQSPGVYRNPTTGANFNSQTGNIRVPRIKPTVPGTGGGVTTAGTTNPAATNMRQDMTPEQAAANKASMIATYGQPQGASNAGTAQAVGDTPATGGGVTAVNNAGGTITNLNPMMDQRKRLVAEVQRRGGNAAAPGFAKKLRALDGQIRTARQTNATGTGTTTPAADTTAPADTTQPGADPNNIANTLFPNTRMFEPENYEGSPLYQFQLKEGNQALARSLAKRGLTNSGAGITEELNVPLRVAAQDTDRMTRIAEGNADRLYNIQNNEANRLERRDDSQWGRIYDTASLMANQSPWDAALGGLDSVAGTTKESGSAMANFLREYYKRSMGGSGGGGGGGGQQIPIPAGPDYSNINGAQIGGDYSSNKGWLNILTQGLAGLFP